MLLRENRCVSIRSSRPRCCECTAVSMRYESAPGVAVTAMGGNSSRGYQSVFRILPLITRGAERRLNPWCQTPKRRCWLVYSIPCRTRSEKSHSGTDSPRTWAAGSQIATKTNSSGGAVRLFIELVRSPAFQVMPCELNLVPSIPVVDRLANRAGQPSQYESQAVAGPLSGPSRWF